MNRKLTAIALITAAILTNAGFTALGSIFNYPDVLKEPTAEILDRFRETPNQRLHLVRRPGPLRRVVRADRHRSRQAARRPVDEARRARRHRRRRRPDHRPVAMAAARARLRQRRRQHQRDNGRRCPGPLRHRPHDPRDRDRRDLRIPPHRRLDAARRRQPRDPIRRTGFAALGTVSAAMIVLGVFSPLDLGLIDTVNFFGYVLWSVWLIWLAIGILRDARSAPTVPCRSARRPSRGYEMTGVAAPRTGRADHHDRRRQRHRHALEHRPRGPSASGDRVPARRHPAERSARRS